LSEIVARSFELFGSARHRPSGRYFAWLSAMSKDGKESPTTTPKGILRRPGESRDEKKPSEMKLSISADERRASDAGGARKIVRQSTKGTLGAEVEERRRLSRASREGSAQLEETLTTESADPADSSSSHGSTRGKLSPAAGKAGAIKSAPAPSGSSLDEASAPAPASTPPSSSRQKKEKKKGGCLIL